jgi:hypothetical protein
MDYFVRYTSRTQFSLSGAPGKPNEMKDFIQVQLPDGEMMVYDHYKEVDSEELHHGLVFDVALEGKRESYARTWANMIRSLISFVAKTEIPRLRLKQQFEEEERHKFEQRHLIAEQFTAKDTDANFDTDLFKELNYNLNKKYENDREAFDALSRAIKYFSKSLEQVNQADRFTMLYLSLEALGNKLLEYYDSQSGSGVNQEDGVSEAFRTLFQDVDGVEFESDIYQDGRNNLFHEAKEKHAIKFVEELEEGVQRGILTLLNVSYTGYKNELRKDAVRNKSELAMRFTGEMSDFDIPNPEPGLNLPFIDTSDLKRKFEWDADEGEFLGYMEVDGEVIKDLDKWESIVKEKFVSTGEEEIESVEFSKGYRG